MPQIILENVERNAAQCFRKKKIFFVNLSEKMFNESKCTARVLLLHRLAR